MRIWNKLISPGATRLTSYAHQRCLREGRSYRPDGIKCEREDDERQDHGKNTLDEVGDNSGCESARDAVEHEKGRLMNRMAHVAGMDPPEMASMVDRATLQKNTDV